MTLLLALMLRAPRPLALALALCLGGCAVAVAYSSTTPDVPAGEPVDVPDAGAPDRR